MSSSIISKGPVFHGTPAFTSTLHEPNGVFDFDIWQVVLTAVFFFVVLAWYTFSLALYEYYANPEDKKKDELRNIMLSTLGYSLIWTLFAALLYWILKQFHVPTHKDEAVAKELHPVSGTDFAGI